MKLEQIPHHLFFHKDVLVTDYGLQYKVGEHSVACNDAMHVLLSLLDIEQGHQPIINLKMLQSLEERIKEINPVNIKPEYSEPDHKFILSLTDLSNRIRAGIVGYNFKGASKTNKTGAPIKLKVLKINFTRLAIVHFNKYGYWASIEQLKEALKAHATTLDKMSEAINSKLSEQITLAKDKVKFNDDLFSIQPVLLPKQDKPEEELILTAENLEFINDAFNI